MARTGEDTTTTTVVRLLTAMLRTRVVGSGLHRHGGSQETDP